MNPIQEQLSDQQRRKNRTWTLPGQGGLLGLLIKDVHDRLQGDDRIQIEEQAEWSRIQEHQTLRIRGRLEPGHEAISDVVFDRRGEDAIIQVIPLRKSLLQVMHATLKTSIVLVLWAVLYGGFLRMTGTIEALVRDYVSHWSGSSVPVDVREAMMAGIQYDPASGKFYRGEELTVWEILRRDPKLFLVAMGGPPAIIMGMLWGVLRLLPKKVWIRVSHALKWPTVEEYEAFCEAHSTFVEFHVMQAAMKLLHGKGIEVHGEFIEHAPPGFGG